MVKPGQGPRTGSVDNNPCVTDFSESVVPRTEEWYLASQTFELEDTKAERLESGAMFRNLAAMSPVLASCGAPR